MMESPIKMDDSGVPLFSETSKSWEIIHVLRKRVTSNRFFEETWKYVLLDAVQFPNGITVVSQKLFFALTR